MLETTLVYIRKNGQTLMLHRVGKANDLNEGKWIGVGGKLEPGETPEQCMLREVAEETGLIPTAYACRGRVHFVQGDWQECMYLFTVTDFAGALRPCDEGALRWIPDGKVRALPAWEGDRVFLERLEGSPAYFELRLTYDGDRLSDAVFTRDDALRPDGENAAEPSLTEGQ